MKNEKNNEIIGLLAILVNLVGLRDLRGLIIDIIYNLIFKI
jgi:hypothetical protein